VAELLFIWFPDKPAFGFCFHLTFPISNALLYNQAFRCHNNTKTLLELPFIFSILPISAALKKRLRGEIFSLVFAVFGDYSPNSIKNNDLSAFSPC